MDNEKVKKKKPFQRVPFQGFRCSVRSKMDNLAGFRLNKNVKKDERLKWEFMLAIKSLNYIANLIPPVTPPADITWWRGKAREMERLAKHSLREIGVEE